MFAVERIVSVEVLEDRFNLPEELKLDQIYENLFGLVDEPAQTVRIQFAPDVAYLVKERRWHPSQQNEIQKDGSVIATLPRAEWMNLLPGFSPGGRRRGCWNLKCWLKP
jgi:hypothetical protein